MALEALEDGPPIPTTAVLTLSAEELQLLEPVCKAVPEQVSRWLESTQTSLRILAGEPCVRLLVPTRGIPALNEWLAGASLVLGVGPTWELSLVATRDVAAPAWSAET